MATLVRETAGKVRVTCPHCGTVEIRGADVMVLSRLEQWHNVYRFECPTCASSVVRPARPDLVRLLLRAGAAVELLPHPLAPQDRGDPSLPRLTAADLVDFRNALDALPTADH